MVWTLNHQNTNRLHCCNGRRIFLTLIFLNTFIGCFYYNQEILRNPSNSSIWSPIVHNSSSDNAIQLIQTILAHEYHHDDLIQFYTHVQTEYSLGLKCTRNSNLTNDISKNMIRENSSSVNSFHSHRTKLNQFIIDQSNACSNQTIDLLIIIISKSDNYQTRDAIRRTWASRKTRDRYSLIHMKYFFLLDFDEKLARSIELENHLFNDIIQVKLPQQYTLVTHRVLSLFEWSFRFCRTAKYLFKSDDDIFFDLILLVQFLSSLIDQPIDQSFDPTTMKIYGYENIQGRVFRQANDVVLTRYIITDDEYPCDRYPTFLSGYGYLISKKGRDAIVYTAYQDPEPFRISDVYLTGIIPEYLSIARQSMSNYQISDGKCEKFFRHSNAFACASANHRGVKSDVFRNYNQYWQVIKKKHRLI